MDERAPVDEGARVEGQADGPSTQTARTAPSGAGETVAVPAQPSLAGDGVAGLDDCAPYCSAGSDIESGLDPSLLAELEAIERGTPLERISISGFMDVNHRKSLKTDPLFQLTERDGSFFVGSANVYLRANISKEMRSLLEVRFTYLPNGAPDGAGDFRRTATDDYTDYDRDVALGSIEIERAHGEYEFAQSLVVRVGQFLTPYGIWNIDHGTPVVIPVSIPYAVGQGLIPERQTGLEVLGTLQMTERLLCSYHATLSNGRGPFESHLDLDKNKALGGRLRLLLTTSLGDIGIGSSVYYGRYTDASGVDIQTGDREIRSQYDELAFAGDVKWTYAGVHAQAEFIHQQVAYAADGRRNLAPDGANWGAYGLAGYRFPSLQLMPFFMYERQDDEVFDLNGWTLGLNYRPLAELVLKVSGTVVQRVFEDDLRGKAIRIDSQVAWAF